MRNRNLPKPAPKTSAPMAPTLRQLLAAAPELGSPAGARQEVERWLRRIGRTGAGKALRQGLAKAPIARRVIEGIAEGSPFLWQLATGHPAPPLRPPHTRPAAHFAPAPAPPPAP